MRGVHMCCSYVESPSVASGGVGGGGDGVQNNRRGGAGASPAGFKIVRLDGNAVTRSIRERDPDRAWARLPTEGNRLRVRKIRERAVRNRAGIGAHLFGLESPRVLRMLRRHRNALALGDEYLIATTPTFIF